MYDQFTCLEHLDTLIAQCISCPFVFNVASMMNVNEVLEWFEAPCWLDLM